ncbi:HU family DNA-binding protein [Microvirga yunnanensis]|uniref:HU family DNA-binding protein n=2 Tax=Microvirga TaxID=186650 RepID=UPI00290570BD|nr:MULTISPECIES: HU family DNA-binding protein [unclassified Microvirga]
MAKAATKTTAKKAPARKAAASQAEPTKTARTADAGAKRSTKAAAPKTSAKAARKGAKKSTGTSAGAILTLRHIAEQLSEVHELPKRQANEILTQVIEMIAKSLKKGDKIRLSGLGILQVRKRAARTGRNPQTGEPIKIKASKKIAFRPTKELKEAV